VLHEFLSTHRAAILARTRAKVAARPTPRATQIELEDGIPLFLDQLIEILRSASGPGNPGVAPDVLDRGSRARRGRRRVRRPPAGQGGRVVPALEQRGRDRTGLGLGLSIARKTIEVNGGLLSVGDIPGIGCVFSIDLPRMAAA
jgi:hypothetical protein